MAVRPDFLRHVLASASITGLCLVVNPANAQQSGASSGNLPPVTIDAPKPRPAASSPSRPARRVAGSATKRGQRQAQTAAAPSASSAPGPQNVRPGQDPRGPINGYVAGRSLTGTKTDTPLMETPQAISVVGSEEIRDQNPNSLAAALRYAPGVRSETFGNDTRNDWFKIRGFDAQDVGLFQDGLQLQSFAFATWKFPPFGVERIDILRGPSAVLYGGSGPGGLVNIISKKPSTDPSYSNYAETGIDSFGNGYLSFDFGGPMATPSGPSKDLFYRLLGTVKGGDTQTAFTPDNSYFVAPSVTYRPDMDTTLTILASASKNDTRVQGFLPYVGTVVAAPFGRIPTGLFASDPSVDKFTREQEMIGYQFEKNLTDDLTVRQNARFAHDDVQFQTLLGNGYVGTPASAQLSRFNDFAHDIANQGNIDTQFEYRFATGPIQHTAVVGVDLKSYEINDLQAFDFATPSLNLLNPVYGVPQGFPGTVFANQTITQEQAGLYAQDQLKLGRFTLVLSGRNDWVDTLDNNRILPSNNLEDSKFSGRAGLIYNTAIGIAPYVSYATSYNPIIGTNTTTGQLFTPETGVQTEAGIKIEPTGFDGHFGVAVFDLKRQNVLTTNPLNVLQSVQTGEVTSRGIELEAVANVAPGLKVTAAFTNFDIFVSKDLNPALIGTVPTNTPSEIASLWGDYTFQTGQLTGFGFGAGVRYNGISYADTANTLVVPSYVVGDAAIHYEVRNWRFALNVTNIGDKIYVGSCQTATACFYGDRRRAVASVSYKW
jgi:iron complex outermembrane receptor protein